MKMVASAAYALASLLLFGVALFFGTPPRSNAISRQSGLPRLFAPGEMPEFPGVFETSLGEDLSLNGVPLRISTFVTDQIPERVVQFYRSELSRLAMPAEERWTVDGCVLTLVLPGSGTTRNIVVRREGNHTRVFAALLPFTASPLRLFPAPDEEVPYGPASLAAMEVDDRGHSRRGRTAIFHEAARIERVRARVNDWMASHHWSSVRDYAPPDQLHYRRGTERAEVRLKSFKAEPPMTSVIYQAKRDDE